MSIPFHPSARGSIGLEWELNLVELDSRGLSGRAPELLGALGATPAGPVRGEYLASMVELVSGVHTRVPDAVAELTHLLGGVLELAEGRGLGVLASGTHPFSRGRDVPVIESEQYDVVRDRNAWWGRRMTICGTHVHVGVPDRDLAMPLVQGLTALAPMLLALSASSPFFEGEDTGFASQRTMLFQQLPTNGIAPELATWAAFEGYFDDLVAAGMASRPSEIRWDVRPSPKFGTVELRVPDSSPTVAEFACVAAWAQCLAEFLTAELLAGREPPRDKAWFVRENKWRAARYGLDARLVTADGAVPLRESVGVWLERLDPIAERFGCSEALWTAEALLASGNSAERQRAAVSATDGDLVGLVDRLLAETKESL